ncbi:MAG: UDP-galactopyranose mutase [Deltaproteobacteria bacterium]|nr:UDP-galactopyranose mutase [Deltaproteobacteria bacterium]
MNTWDIIVVGAGFAGVVSAERLASQGKKVLLIEKRPHIGGNSYDCYDGNGILVHLYGPHIFHTKYKEVWDYLSRFTEWRLYTHRVLAHIDGIKVPLPFNLNTMEALFPQSLASRLEDKLISTFGYGTRVPILEMMEHKDKDIKFLAEFVYDKVFLNYTVKQWGIRPEEIDPSVTARVPVLISRDDRYFQNPYQGIPANGYTKMFERMLDNPNINIMLNTDYKDIIDHTGFKRMIYTGPIDYFFDYKNGKLPYRSINFDFKTMNMEQFQEVAVVNYPNDYEFTRITESKHLTGQKHKATTIVKEFPEDYDPDKNVPSYPVHRPENIEIYERYKNDAQRINNVTFLGRLAEYKYYNMDEVVEKALSLCKELIN